MAGDDFLTDLWKVMREHVGTAAADRELLALRRRWGGTRVYLKLPQNLYRSETSYEPRALPERKR